MVTVLPSLPCARAKRAEPYAFKTQAPLTNSEVGFSGERIICLPLLGTDAQRASRANRSGTYHRGPIEILSMNPWADMFAKLASKSSV